MGTPTKTESNRQPTSITFTALCPNECSKVSSSELQSG